MKRISILMLATAELLASCSQNDELQNTVSENEGLKPMTISVAIPEGMTTRAAAADDAEDQRCFVQILSGDGQDLEGEYSNVQPMEKTASGYTATVYLNDNDTYDFLFWADSEQSGTTPDDLRNVAYTNGSTLAWAGTALDQQWSADGVTCQLKHVVSRITLNTTSDFTVSADYPLIIGVLTTYSAYNVQTSTPIGSTSAYTYECPEGSYTDAAAVGHFYVMGNGGTQDLTFQYDGPLNNPSITIVSVPLNANTHVTLSGNVYNAGLVSGIITATVDNDWADGSQDF